MLKLIVSALLMLQAESGDGTAQPGAPVVTIDHVRGAVHVIDGAVDRIGVSAGPDGILLVDTGYPGRAAAVEARIASLGRGRPKVVINTHIHHAFGNSGFAEALIVAHQRVAARLTSPRFMFDQTVAPAPAEALPDVTFQDRHSFRFNGETLDLVHLPPGHTDGDALVIFRESGVVLTGDAFVPHLTWIDYAAGGTLEGYLDALDRMIEIVPQDAVLIPGHGRTATYQDLVAVRAAFLSAVEWVRSGMQAGRSLPELQRAGLPDHLRSWTDGGVPAGLVIESIYKGLNVRQTGRACEFLNGRWFNGRIFERRPGFYAVDGVLTVKRPPVVECSLDLGDRFVIPPLADAHTHDLGRGAEFAKSSADWLKQGVYYAMVQDPVQTVGPELKARAAAPDAVNAVYTHGVVTSSWNFIADLYADLTRRGEFGEGRRIEDVEGTNFFAIDTVEDLEKNWPRIAERNTRFIKLIAAFSEQFEKRKNNPAFTGTAKPGLNPALLPEIVRRAHSAGLRVSVHIETAADFRRAVTARADLIAHLPGWQVGLRAGFLDGDVVPWILTENDAAAAAALGVLIVSTVNKTTASQSVHSKNLRLLHQAGARIVIGSDGFDGPNLWGELDSLDSLSVLPRAELLRIAVQDTALAIFPDRKIGALEEGHEASFLVLDRDPIQDLDALKELRLRVKQGLVLR